MGKKKAVFLTAMADEDQKTASGANASFDLMADYLGWEIVGRLAFAYGLQPEPAPRTPESLIADFSWDKVPKQDICLPENLF